MSSPEQEPEVPQPPQSAPDIDVDSIIWDDQPEVLARRPSEMDHQLSEAADDVIACLLGSDEDRKYLRIALGSIGMKLVAC